MRKMKKLRTEVNFRIAHRIPMPQRRIVVGQPPKYPFRKMKIGDSFMIPYVQDGRLFHHGTLNAILQYWNKTLADKHFHYRSVDDGWRIWRKK